MISEFFLNIVFGIASSGLSKLPDIEWTLESTAMEYFLNIVRVAGYMFPFDTVFTIIRLVIAFTIARIVIATIKTVWDLLPLV